MGYRSSLKRTYANPVGEYSSFIAEAVAEVLGTQNASGIIFGFACEAY